MLCKHPKMIKNKLKLLIQILNLKNPILYGKTNLQLIIKFLNHKPKLILKHINHNNRVKLIIISFKHIILNKILKLNKVLLDQFIRINLIQNLVHFKNCNNNINFNNKFKIINQLIFLLHKNLKFKGNFKKY